MDRVRGDDTRSERDSGEKHKYRPARAGKVRDLLRQPSDGSEVGEGCSHPVTAGRRGVQEPDRAGQSGEQEQDEREKRFVTQDDASADQPENRRFEQICGRRRGIRTEDEYATLSTVDGSVEANFVLGEYQRSYLEGEDYENGGNAPLPWGRGRFLLARATKP